MERLLQQAFTTILISVLVEIVVANNLPKWRKKEQDEKRAAIEEQKVFFTRIMIKQITVIIAVLIVCGLLFVLFPWLLDWVEVDYKIVLLVYWGYVFLMLMLNLPKLVKYEYNEECFKRINAFGFIRCFRYEDVVEVIETKTAYKIITKTKKLRFGRGLCGADNFIIYLQKKCNFN